MHRWSLLFSLPLIFACAGPPLVAGSGEENGLQARIDEVVAPYLEASDFMGVVAIQKQGGPPLIRAYGMASAEQRAPHTDDGIFMIGSVSKQFTAVATLLLEQDGRLSITDRIGVHLPGFPHGDNVTILQLLTHTAGIQDVYSLASFGRTRGRGGPFESVIGEIGAAPLTDEPGTAYRYSNGGYSVLAAIIESASGRSYGEFLQERLFLPLGMRKTFDDREGPVVEGMVRGYDPWGSHMLTPAIPVSSAYLKGSGSLWSSAGDLLRWCEALHGGQILTEASYRKLIQDYGHGYGLGVSVFRRFGRSTIGHDGRISGYASDVARYLDEDVSVIVLSNVQSASRDWIRQQVAAAVFDETASQPAAKDYADSPLALAGFAGRYSFGPGFIVKVEARGGRLMAAANEGGWSELVPLSDGMWFSRMLYATVRFDRDADGRAQSLIWGAGEGAPVGARVD